MCEIRYQGLLFLVLGERFLCIYKITLSRTIYHHNRDTQQFQQPRNLGCILSWSTPTTCTEITTIVTSIIATFYPCLICSMYSFLSANIILGNISTLLNSSLSFLLICHNSADRYLDCFSFRL